MAQQLNLSSEDLHAISGALRVAAVQYAIDAETAAAMPRVAEQFRAQAAQANALADRIDDHDNTDDDDSPTVMLPALSERALG